MSTSAKPTILSIGVAPDDKALDQIAPPHVVQMVKENLEKAEEYAKQQGFDYEFLGHGPNDDHQIIVKKLQSKKYDAVIIGGGIKVAPQCNDLLEIIVNGVRQHSPQSHVLFTPSGDKIINTVERAGQLASKQ